MKRSSHKAEYRLLIVALLFCVWWAFSIILA